MIDGICHNIMKISTIFERLTHYSWCIWKPVTTRLHWFATTSFKQAPSSSMSFLCKNIAFYKKRQRKIKKNRWFLGENRDLGWKQWVEWKTSAGKLDTPYACAENMGNGDFCERNSKVRKWKFEGCSSIGKDFSRGLLFFYFFLLFFLF